MSIKLGPTNITYVTTGLTISNRGFLGEDLVYGQYDKPPNLFIGGVGNTYISNIADLQYVTQQFTPDYYQNFVIDVNNNISVYADGAFRLSGGTAVPYAFSGISELTYFLDLTELPQSGQYIGDELFLNSGVRHLYLPNMQTTHSHPSYVMFSTMQEIRHINFEALTLPNANGMLYLAGNLEKVYLPSVTDFNFYPRSGCFSGLTKLKRFYIANATASNEDITRWNCPFEGIPEGAKIYHNSALGVEDRNAWMTVRLAGNIASNVAGDTFVLNGLTYTAVTGVPTTDGEFSIDGTFVTVRSSIRDAINNDTRIGLYGNVTMTLPATWSDRAGFQTDLLGVSGNLIEFDNSGLTSPSSFSSLTGTTFIGGFDVAQILVFARDFESADLVEVSTPIEVNQPTNLDYQNLTSSSVELTFTEPIPNANGTDGYEVWVDDGTIYRKLFEYSEITGSGGFVDLQEVVDDVGTINGTKIKIRTFDGHFNFSGFSNEIMLPLPNTFIGGVAATINTPALLASTIGAVESDIYSFTIDGSDISFYTTVNYTLPESAFDGNTDITHYEDLDGYAITTNNYLFRSTTSMNYVRFNRVGARYGLRFLELSTIVNFYAPNSETIGNRMFVNCNNLVFIDCLSTVISIQNQALFVTPLLIFPFTNNQITLIGIQTMQSCGFTEINSTSLTEIGPSTCRAMTNLTIVNCPNILTLRSFAFLVTPNVNEFIFPLCTLIEQGAFSGCTNTTNIELPSVTSLGLSVTDINVFANCVNLATLTVPIAMQTINGGNPHASVQRVITDYGTTVIYV
jgi:hypothetical protein